MECLSHITAGRIFSIKSDTCLIPSKHFLFITLMTIRLNFCQLLWFYWCHFSSCYSVSSFVRQGQPLGSMIMWNIGNLKIWECGLEVTDEQNICLGHLRTLATSWKQWFIQLSLFHSPQSSGETTWVGVESRVVSIETSYLSLSAFMVPRK